VFRIWVKRARCKSCGGSSHALLPSFCLLRRLDAVDVIGPAVTAVATGAGTRSVAKGIGKLFAHTTVRGWWRRHRERVRAALLEDLAATASALRVSVPQRAVVTDADGIRALETLGVSVSAGLGIAVWPAVSLLSAGAWLSTTTDTPFLADPGRRLMTAMAAYRSTIPP
jgi:hypothetical protein